LPYRVAVRLLIAVSLIVFAVDAGCATVAAASVARDSALDRAANEFNCARSSVVATPRPELSDRTWDVTACGHSARYTCPANDGFGYQSSTRVRCIREPIDAPTRASDAGAP
jgi:hypothetical protein